ncbi:MAG: hypothetical protein LBG60_16945 [Bifidobacteriaceae bacterium]|nr:hypothetical protein [Bifidobacteriaceae bacterium]
MLATVADPIGDGLLLIGMFALMAGEDLRRERGRREAAASLFSKAQRTDGSQWLRIVDHSGPVRRTAWRRLVGWAARSGLAAGVFGAASALTSNWHWTAGIMAVFLIAWRLALPPVPRSLPTGYRSWLALGEAAADLTAVAAAMGMAAIHDWAQLNHWDNPWRECGLFAAVALLGLLVRPSVKLTVLYPARAAWRRRVAQDRRRPVMLVAAFPEGGLATWADAVGRLGVMEFNNVEWAVRWAVTRVGPVHLAGQPGMVRERGAAAPLIVCPAGWWPLDALLEIVAEGLADRTLFFFPPGNRARTAASVVALWKHLGLYEVMLPEYMFARPVALHFLPGAVPCLHLSRARSLPAYSLAARSAVAEMSAPPAQ